jgi:hypothetical protein
MQHFLNFNPLPQGHGSFLPTCPVLGCMVMGLGSLLLGESLAKAWEGFKARGYYAGTPFGV